MNQHMENIQSESVTAAIAVMRAHIQALNARDGEAIAATLHFPHYRLTDGQVKVWDGPENYLSDFRARAGGEWGHSDWCRLDVVHASEDKVHLDVQVQRFSRDGSLLIAFDSLWVIARLSGVWAAQFRSSFAPDARIRSGGERR